MIAPLDADSQSAQRRRRSVVAAISSALLYTACGCGGLLSASALFTSIVSQVSLPTRKASWAPAPGSSAGPSVQLPQDGQQRDDHDIQAPTQAAESIPSQPPASNVPSSAPRNDNLESSLRCDNGQASNWRYPCAVTLTTSNMKYSERFEDILASIAMLGGMRLVVAALDEETAKFFSKRGVPVLPMFVNKSSHLGIRQAVMRAKIDVPYMLLSRGLRVVFCEMDIYLRQDPLILEKELDGDFLVSQHNYDIEINIGFWIAKPVASVLHFFDLLRKYLQNEDWMTKMGCNPTFDQKVMDFAVRGDPRKLKGACRFSQRTLDSLYDSQSAALRWNYIPWSRFPHYLPSFRFNQSLVNAAVGAHIWSGAGPVEKQIQLAHQYGLWFLKHLSPTENPGLRCDKRLVFVVSLPRTGTTAIYRFGTILGYQTRYIRKQYREVSECLLGRSCLGLLGDSQHAWGLYEDVPWSFLGCQLADSYSVFPDLGCLKGPLQKSF
eukprot:TRINITY_DN20966_c0_g1_i2.p1 TRINITY_DN20966_c0_g1~~TRINITY_DN20966_c0_g1_i2.p1  ORF type:complete len:493 (+),score=30.71 TRINITY_DN20966_c0_g1_i2:224-1702(+)